MVELQEGRRSPHNYFLVFFCKNQASELVDDENMQFVKDQSSCALATIRPTVTTEILQQQERTFISEKFSSFFLGGRGGLLGFLLPRGFGWVFF